MPLNNKYSLNQVSHFKTTYQGKFFQISHGFVHEINRNAILKVTNQTPSYIARLKYEHYLLTKLETPGVPKLIGIISDQQNYGLLLEDYGSLTLKDYYKNTIKLCYRDFIDIAIKIVKVISNIHKQRIFHKAIRPESILMYKNTPYIIDFSHATDFAKEKSENATPFNFEELLPCMSPEQTGRMNRDLDYRTDFYSLGATFYQILSGRPMFMAIDTLDWIHCHLALTPISLTTINPEIPPMLNEIVMKLVSKNPEERYQSANGLLYDLALCQRSPLSTFELGKQDFSHELQAPKKLYGRELQVEKLLNAFEDASKGQAVLALVSGFSGIGKTSVVHEIHKPITAKRGLFLSGKCDQLRRNTPYAAILESFESLIQQLLASPSNELAIWRHKIIEALGSNAQYLVNVLPSLSSIIDVPPVLPPDTQYDHRNRFELTIRAFIKVFTQKTHPLVIFLDDLQWVDSASLKLIKTLLNDPEQRHLLLIGAYRDNEISEDHHLYHAINDFKQGISTVFELHIDTLTRTEADQIILDMLCSSVVNETELQACIYQKTAGNPFFILQLMQTLNQEEILTWDKEEFHWTWSQVLIEELGIDDDVIALMKRQLYKLPPQALELIKQASCIGNRFSLTVLKSISHLDLETIHDLLTTHCHHLVQPVKEAYRQILVAQDFPNIEVRYKFLHDRIQQAAYHLMLEEQRVITHLKIARGVTLNATDKYIKDNLFFIVDQFNGGYLISSEKNYVTKDELSSLIRLNYKAGEKSIQASAYGVALHYFKTAISLIQQEDWTEHYSFYLSLFTLAAEAAMYHKTESAMMHYVRQVRLNAQSIIDEIPVIELQIRYAAQHNKLTQALDLAAQTLHALGVKWYTNIKEHELDRCYKEIEDKIHALGGPDAFLELPQETDQKQLAIIRILVSMIETTRGHSHLLFQENILLIMQRSLNSIHPYMGFILGCYGLLLCGVRSQLKTGVKFGVIAEKVAKTHQSSQYYARMKFVVYSNVRCFGPAFASNLQGLKDSFEYGFETGDLNYAGHANLQYIVTHFFIGTSLHDVFTKLNKYVPRMTSLGLDFDRQFLMPLYQLVYNLRTSPKNPHVFKGPYFSESSLEVLRHAENKMHPFSAYSAKGYLCYIMNEYEEAYNALNIADSFLPVMTGLIHHHQHIFIFGLCHLAMSRIEDNKNCAYHLEEAQKAVTRLEFLSQNAPENFYNKVLLLKAEFSRSDQKFTRASMLYNQAIAAAEETGLLHELALSHELAAEFFMEFGHKQAAAHSFVVARDLYNAWGAKAKATALEKKHPFLDHDYLLDEISAHELFKMKEQPKKQQDIDNLTLMRLSQLISRQIDINKLPPLLMNIMAVNAGADRGCFLLKQSENFIIEAAFPEMVRGEYGYQAFNNWSSTAIHYVAHSKECLLVADASKDTLCCSDPYIQNSSVKSLMCIPIIDKGRLLGILYLENSQSSHIFTQQLVDFMQVIASQVAISLENCHLFSELQATKEAQHEQAELYESILNSVGEGIVIADSEFKSVHFNPAAKKILCLDSHLPSLGDWFTHYTFYDPNYPDTPLPANSLPMIRALAGEQVEELEILIKNNINHKESIIAATGCPIYATDGTVQNAVVVIRDISDRKEREVQMRHLATHDSLTHLPNRALFIKRLHQAMEMLDNHNSVGAVMFLDLDNFKEI
ncbi:MAG TPA: hypothetical protein DDW29_00235, partial [Gammaproteobacteria bacterium]|nr:hypothetical protein [Gammaproteobacteria bacterium]